MNYDKVLDYSKKISNIIAKRELSEEEKNWLTEETVAGLKENYNPGFKKYPCPITATNQPDPNNKEVITNPGCSKSYSKLDCLGRSNNTITGSFHPKIVETVKSQLDQQTLQQYEMLEPLKVLLSRLIAMIAPGDLQASFFTGNASEAFEGALWLARMRTGKSGVLTATGKLNGKASGSIKTTPGEVTQNLEASQSSLYHQVPFDNPDEIYKALSKSTENDLDIGAIILKPIHDEGGVHVPQDDYFLQVRDICDEYGLLLIIDETQTGIGQTGKLFAIEHYGIVPDILCLGKVLGSGIVPIGILIYTRDVWDKINTNPFVPMAAYAATPLACATAIAGLQVILGEGLVEQAAEKGNYFLPMLQGISSKYPELKSVQGKGLLIGLEFSDHLLCYRIAQYLLESGIPVSIASKNPAAIKIEPPLTITIEEIDHILEALENALNQETGN